MSRKIIERVVLAMAIGFASVPLLQAGTHSDATPVAILKRAYLDCERRALAQPMTGGEVAQCSEIYEELKQRAFYGDWRLIREWTQSNLKPGLDV